MNLHLLDFTLAACLVAASAVAQTPPANTATGPAQSTPAATAEQGKPKESGNGWNVWETGPITTRLVLTFGADVGGFIQDDANTEQVDHQPTLVKWRAERINFGGTINFKNPWVWQVGGNFNGLEADKGDRWSWMDVRLDIPVPQVGRVRIGRQKVGVSEEWVMPLIDWVFMERASSSNAFVPQRNVGVVLTNSYAHDRVMWSAGWFNDWFAQDNSFTGNGNQYSARLSALPVVGNAQDNTVVQVGGAMFYREPTNGQLQFRARPEINQSDYFVDTGKFDAKHSVTSQFEAMVLKGRTQIFGEWSMNSVSAPTAQDPFFYGGFAGFSYFLTRDSRGFNRREGCLSRLNPQKPVRFSGGGWGAWEVGARYSYVNLTGGLIDGGRMSRWSGEVSWFATREWQLRFDYGYITLRRGGTTGHAHGISARIAWNM